jgi:hypothetical protein
VREYQSIRVLMEALKDYIRAKKLDEKRILNLLQDYGIISDMCVTVEEVGDAGKAVAWLELKLDSLSRLD